MQGKVLIKNILNSDWFIGTALFFILLFEYFSCQSIDYKFYNYSQSIKYYYYFDTFNVAIVLLILIILVCILGANTKIYNLKLELLARKFLDNAIGIGPLPFIFVIVFLIHVALFGSIFYDIFIKSEDIFCNLFRLLIFVFGLYFIFVIYSGRSRQKINIPKEKRKLLVTGLSLITPHNIKGFIEPLKQYPNIDCILILLSDALLSNKSDLKKQIQIKSFVDDYVVDKLNLKSCENLYTDNKNVNFRPYSTQIDDYIEQNKFALQPYIDLDILFKRYRSAEKESSEKMNLLYTFITEYIRVNIQKDIEIEFTRKVDPNNIEDMYSVLSQKLKGIERDTYETVINISPGTSLISSVLSLFAVKGNREMVYLQQENINETKLKLIDGKLDVWSISEVISEFLDERERRDYK